MKRVHVEAFLEALGASPQGTRRHWVVAKCPMARWTHDGGRDRHPSFGIKVDDRREGSPCRCFSCGWRGGVHDLAWELRHRGYPRERVSAALRVLAAALDDEVPLSIGALAEDDRDGAPMVSFPEWRLDALEPAYARGRVHPYLEERRIRYEEAELLDVRWDPDRERIVFPVRDFDGELRGLHGRGVHEDQHPKYLAYAEDGRVNWDVWYGEERVDLEDPVVVVEGPFDVARVLEVYPNVVSPFGATPSESKLRRLSAAEEVVLLLDPDAGGDQGVDRFREVLADTPIRRCYLGADPADSTAREIARALHKVGSL